MADKPIWIPDKRLLMPELFEPGRRPAGPVQIDWDNAFAKGITNLLLTVKGGVLNLVNNSPFINAAFDPGVNRGNETVAIDFFNPDAVPVLPLGGKWSLATSHYYRKDYPSESNGPDYIIRVDGTGLGTTYFNYIASNKPYIRLDGDVSRLGPDGITTGDKGQQGGTYDSSANIGTVYQRYNDVLFEYYSNTIPGTATDCFLHSSTDTDQPRFEIVVTWNEVKSREFFDEFFSDPFQILKSAIDVPLALYSAGAPPSAGIAPLHFHHRHHNMAG